MTKLSLSNIWKVKVAENLVYASFQSTNHILPKFLLMNVYISLFVYNILSERFCQDGLENYFGRQRAIGSRRVNPSMKDVGHNDNTIKPQYSVRPIAGNVRGGEKWNIIDNTSLPKRRKSTSRM